MTTTLLFLETRKINFYVVIKSSKKKRKRKKKAEYNSAYVK